MRLTLLPLAVMLVSAPLAAQQTGDAPTPAQRQLIIYGNDPCPADTICVTAPEEERYRIPKNLRAKPFSPANQSWSVRAQAAMEEGKSGAGSCSAVGAGGWTGCYMEQMRKAREETRQNSTRNADVP